MTRLTLATLFVVVCVFTTLNGTNAECKDMSGCVRRTKNDCHRPGVQNNCKQMCGLCPSASPQRIRASAKKAQPARARQAHTSPKRARTNGAHGPGAKKSQGARRRAAQQKRNNPGQVQQRQACTDNHVNCVHWARNGYCTSAYRGDDEKRQYCANTCNLCPAVNNPGGNRRTRKPVRRTRAPVRKQTTTTASTTTATTTTTAPPPPEVPYPFFEHSLDESVNPCDDFYRFACGRYQTENPASSTQSFSRFIEHNQQVEKQLIAAVFGNEATTSKAVQKMRKYRDACMDSTSINKEKTTGFRADLTAIGMPPMLSDPTTYVATKFKLTDTLKAMNRLSGQNFFFSMEPYTDSTTGTTTLFFKPMEPIIKDPKDYTNVAATPKVDALKTFLNEIVGYVLQDMAATGTVPNGVDFNYIKTAVDEVIDLDKALAAEYDNEDVDDPTTMQATLGNIKTIGDFTAIMKPTGAPNELQLDVDDYLKTNILLQNPQVKAYVTKVAGFDVYLHTDQLFINYMKVVAVKPSTSTPAITEKHFENYMFIKYLLYWLPYLDSRFATSANRLAVAIGGNPQISTRQADCFEAIKEKFPMVVDHQYVERFMSARTNTSANNIMDKMREGFGNLLRSAKWLDSADQQYGVRKLGATKAQIGEVEEARSKKKLDAAYSGVTFNNRDTFKDMTKKVTEVQNRNKYQKLVRANAFVYDKSMSVNGLGTNFINEQNQLFIPAAILQHPFLNTSLPASVSYGALGFLYGFGLGHGFDKQGGNFDANGVQRSWWNTQTKNGFKAKKQCLVTEYDGLTEPVTGNNVDGRKTLVANIADGGAIRSAYQAYSSYAAANPITNHVPGYAKYNNDQTFFISYATMMCASYNQKDQDKQMQDEDFAPNEFRVNTLLSNYDMFSSAFKCPAGAKMNPSPKCSVW